MGVARLVRAPSLQIVIGLAVGQAVVLGVTPLLTRHYSPDLMGVAAVFLTIATIMGTTGTMRSELLIPTAPQGQISWLAKMGTFSLLAISAGVGLVASAFRRFDATEATLLALTVFGIGATALTLQLSARFGTLRGVAMAKAGQGVVQGGSQAGLGVAGLVAYGMPLGYALGYLGAAAIQLRSLLKAEAFHWRSRDSTIPRSRLIRKSLVLTFAALVNITAVSLLPLVTQVFFGDAVTGELAVAQRLAVAPAGLLVAALMPVAAARFGQLIRAGEPTNGEVRRWLLRLAVPALGWGVILWLIPETWFGFLLGNDWMNVKAYVVALSVSIVVQIVVGPLGQLLAMFGRVGTQLAWDVARLAALIGITWIVARATGDPVATVFVGAVTLAVFYLVFLVLIAFPKRGDQAAERRFHER